MLQVIYASNTLDHIMSSKAVSRVVRGHCIVVVVSTHSLDHCLWGESDHPTFGPPASISLHLASNSITPSGSVHKSRGDSVVRMWVQLKRWCVSCVCRVCVVCVSCVCRVCVVCVGVTEGA